jgi:hypothetical protein
MSDGTIRAEPRLTVLLFALLALSVVRLWLMPLGSSFWVDEMGTVFVVQHGAAHPSLAVAPQVPKSIYYWLPRAASAVFGSSEVVYRLPSTLAMGLALLLIARLAGRLIHPRAAWFAAFACLALSGIGYQADDARPYALGTLAAAAGALGLVRWLDGGRWRDGLLFACSAALLWRVHLIYWPFYLVFAIYAGARLLRRETPVGWLRAAAVFGLAGLALAPVLVDALALLREAPAHVIVKPPSLHAFEHLLRWNVVLICAGGAWLLARVRRWPRPAYPVSATSLTLVLAWWLCQPVGLYAFSRLTGNSVFIPRYLSIMLPGVALSATALAARWVPLEQWKRLAALVGVGALLVQGQWTRVWPVHEHSDWRGAARQVNTLALGPATPVICPSPFIEARPPEWRPGYPLPGFLYSFLPVYPITGQPILLPFATSPEAEAYAAQLARETLASSRRFLIYGGDGPASFWSKWLAARPELAGWSYARHTHGDVDVVEFNPPNQGPRSVPR